MHTTAPLATGGNRLTWPELPAPVRAQIERITGARVTAGSSRAGGFSPGLASVLALEGGGSVFAKACGRTRNDFTVRALRREAAVLACLPAAVPAPRLLGAAAVDVDGDEWAILVQSTVEGSTPRQPWLPGELDRFLDAATALADSLADNPVTFARPFSEDPDFTRWPELDAVAVRLAPAVRGRLDTLAALGEGFGEATAGDALLHGDVRADNFVLGPSAATFVDWPSVATGAGWLDLLAALPSVAMHGGGDPDVLWRRHPLSEAADPDAVDRVLAGFASFFLHRSLQPPVPLLPTIRAFQRAQADVTLAWLGRRLGWA
jgi:aminoglycoside phosphotransferase (APT) family kinase protein